MWESWRTYISFGLAGAIFILCQALAGGGPGAQPNAAASDPGDRSYRSVTANADLPAARLAPVSWSARDDDSE